MKNYKNKEWLYNKYAKEGLSTYQISESLECSAPTISNWLKRHGIELRTRSDYLTANISEKYLRRFYLEEKKTIAEVSEILAVSQNTVIKYLRKYSIKSRKVADYPSFYVGHLKGRKKLEGRARSLSTRTKISKSRTKGEWKGISNQESIFKQYSGKPEYKIWRQSIFDRDNFTCQECSIRGGYLELHHIIPLRDYGAGIMEDSNVITLCKKCHCKTKNCEYEFIDKYLSIVLGVCYVS